MNLQDFNYALAADASTQALLLELFTAFSQIRAPFVFRAGAPNLEPRGWRAAIPGVGAIATRPGISSLPLPGIWRPTSQPSVLCCRRPT